MTDDVVITPTLADATTSALLHARKAANAAATAAAAAVNSANAAEDIYHNFNYGILQSDPGVRPDGTPTQEGDEYFNSTQRAKKMYADGQWVITSFAVTQAAMLGSNNLRDVSSVAQSRVNLGLKAAAVMDAGTPNGVATLDASGHLPADQFDPTITGALQVDANLSDLDDAAAARTNLELGTAAVKDIAAANGVAGLDAGGKVPTTQLPVGTALGLATLDALSHVPLAQLLTATPNGLATLNSSGVVPPSQLPAGAISPISVAKAIDYTTVSGDQGKVIWVTVGSVADVSIRLVGAGTAGDGATMIVAKADGGTKKCIVLDSDGATNIAWLTNQYDTVCFRSNGSLWSRYWHRILPRVETFVANGTWTRAPLAEYVFVSLLGAGGGGGGASGGLPGSGGGGGARAEAWFRAATVSGTESVTVQSGTTAQRTNGGNSSFGTRLLAGGGKSGADGGGTGNGNGGGGGFGGVGPVSTGDGGLNGGGPVTASDGGSSVYGGGAGGAGDSSGSGNGNKGGSSYFGGGGGGSIAGTFGVGGITGSCVAGGGNSSAAYGMGGSYPAGAGGIGGGGGGSAGGGGGTGGRGDATITTVF